MKVLVLIPARFASTRFPGKPLARICDREMVLHVCDQVCKTGYDFAVATDDRRIADRVEEAGYKAVMTADTHISGTERIAEAYVLLGSDADVVVNVQGDEPFITKDHIEALVSLFREHTDTQLATLVTPFPKDGSFEELCDPNKVKVVVSDSGSALYFSRSVIPFRIHSDKSEWPSTVPYYTHIGIYAYSAETLQKVVRLPRTFLEISEGLEQLRWLQHGYIIRTAIVRTPTIGIDTPADLEAARRFYNSAPKS